ncbi:MAG: hypothetical protein Q9191_007576 [Dirinaria sp. TL-2023a]
MVLMLPILILRSASLKLSKPLSRHGTTAYNPNDPLQPLGFPSPRTNSNDQSNTQWTDPQTIATDPKPKTSSPLAAIAFQFEQGVTELRVYYLDNSNRVVEYQTSLSSPSDPSWFRGRYFPDGSTGGLAALWLGSEGIRLYVIDENNTVAEIVWYDGSWGTAHSIELHAQAGTAVAVQDFTLNGKLSAISLLYTNVEEDLVEGTYDPSVDPNSFLERRVVHPGYGIGQLAIAIDYNEYKWRAYGLSKGNGLMQKWAPPYGDYSSYWDVIDHSPNPDASLGPVAALAWKNNVRVFYTSAGVLVEEGYLYTSSGTEGKWVHLGAIA